jgi:type VI protein secretion system component VasK
LIAVDGQARRAATEQRLFSFLFIVCATVFLTNRLTLAYFWNRRAARLGRQRERLEAWRAGGPDV